MAVDWRLGLVDSGRAAMDTMAAFDAGRKATIEQNAIRTREAGRARASQQLAAGNVAQAQQTAMASGDFDYAKAIGSYSDDQRKQFDAEAEALGSAAYSLKSLPVEQRAQAFSQVAQRLGGMFSREELAHAYQGLQQSGWSDQVLDGYINQALSAKDALAAHTKANEQYTLAPGSARYDAQGNLIRQQAFAPQLRSVGAGDTLVEIQPGGGGPASTGAGGPLSVDSVLPHIVAQESGGNYAARNNSTGALGAYQVMPATAETLAGRLGLPWRPELMASDTPEGRTYQDAVGRAAVQEAVNASGGDPRAMAMYYHGGSDQSKWGPKTRQYADEVTARLMGGADGGSRVVAQGGPKQKDPPSGYRWADSSQTRLEPIPGGPGAGKPGGDRKAEADLRKEFNQLQEVKDFKGARSAFYNIKSLAEKRNPTPQDDIALVFAYMKALDPTSVVREGEFATAQNAGSVPDNIRNAYNKAMNGTRLNPQQRNNMLQAATSTYLGVRSRYNERAREYRGYANDYEIGPDRIAKEYTDGPRRPAGSPAPTKGWGKATVVNR
ncbi:MAG TPA: transglycosylase SLT domain-containing protein [Sphingobium sp.]|nr:transglycosylase SLT domain-containing protein [Sphingobium sp.]